MLYVSATDLDEDGAVDAVSVARFLPEERRCVILRLHCEEPIVSANPPAVVRGKPLQSTPRVAGQKRRRVVDAECRAIGDRESADAAREIRDDMSAAAHRDDDVAVVVDEV